MSRDQSLTSGCFSLFTSLPHPLETNLSLNLKPTPLKLDSLTHEPPGALLSPPPALDLKAHAITASFPTISEDPNSGPHAAQKHFAHYAISPAPSVSFVPCQMANIAIGMYIWMKIMYMGFQATRSFTNPLEVLGRVGGR